MISADQLTCTLFDLIEEGWHRCYHDRSHNLLPLFTRFQELFAFDVENLRRNLKVLEQRSNFLVAFLKTSIFNLLMLVVRKDISFLFRIHESVRKKKSRVKFAGTTNSSYMNIICVWLCDNARKNHFAVESWQTMVEELSLLDDSKDPYL
ncbi:unnamed protein product [Sphenostylis stenocarpa]|uniref:Uncharacterized protein n=1 Tax=Sphenostylis stenocarpa TaxID=92480 RepID=A0AA86S872_9FABA|nr:unnamed protein product [Sphenostylis stenocarpa]